MEQVHYIQLCRKEIFLQGNKFGPVSYKVWYPTCNFQIHHPADTTFLGVKKSPQDPKTKLIFFVNMWIYYSLHSLQLHKISKW